MEGVVIRTILEFELDELQVKEAIVDFVRKHKPELADHIVADSVEFRSDYEILAHIKIRK